MDKKILLLNNKQIDTQLWDKVIQNAPNSRVYAESWYLDCVAPNWQGLIYGNYEYIMPVIGMHKWGLNYAIQPMYCQQLGIFPTATPSVSLEFINSLKSKFKYFQIPLNSLNIRTDKVIDVDFRKNYILSLNPAYTDIKKKYTKHTLRYLPKAQATNTVMKNIGISDFIEFKSQNSQKSFTKTHKTALQLIIAHSTSKARGIIYGAYSPKNELIAAAFFLKSAQRYIYLSSVSSDEGKANRAMYAIIDQFIADHAQQAALLDFEGSMLEGIARFFAGFGAQPETYQVIKHNNLPGIVKWFKK
jgi:hypothetical protein